MTFRIQHIRSKSLPVLNIRVPHCLPRPTLDQGLRVPVIAVISNGGGAERPGGLCTHIAKNALGERDKIRAVRRIRLT